LEKFAMRPSIASLLSSKAGLLAVAIALLAGCQAPAPVTGPIAPESQVRNSVAGGKLINEGGPVFALPGTVHLPTYFAGDPATLTVRAERLDGGVFPRVAPAPVAADGSFKLSGPITSQLFFATAEFTAKDGTHRVRALARAEEGSAIVLDTASTLVTAKIAVAAQARRLDDMSYRDTAEVVSQVRSVLATKLDAVSLDLPNEQLSDALDAAASGSDAVAASLAKWEATLKPSPTPAPSPTAKPAASPSASPSAAATSDPNSIAK
jgi:hypothetical protein